MLINHGEGEAYRDSADNFANTAILIDKDVEQAYFVRARLQMSKNSLR